MQKSQFSLKWMKSGQKQTKKKEGTNQKCSKYLRSSLSLCPRFIQPTIRDFFIGSVLREIAIEPGAKRMAKNKLNILGEYKHMSAHLNSSPRCKKLRQALQLSGAMQSTEEITAQEKEVKEPTEISAWTGKLPKALHMNLQAARSMRRP
jgi:hypothetical protein